ncbi:MAG: polysaccharide deacetylase [Firmicutes bacterium]|nr:polysaccharide deacetylase [Bacillota bacterium]
MPPVTSKEMLADGLDAELLALAKVMEQRYGDLTPREWGERVTGVITRIDTSDKVIALTFDACGASGLSAGYDRELIDFLTQEQIPATLFLSGQWIEANKQIARELAQNPLFVIENHGYRHRPLSVAGKNAYGIEGTGSIREVVAEIGLNDRLIKELTGRAPVYYRSGTAYYDEVAVMIARDMGKEVINFNVLGDAGATFSNAQIEKNLLGAKPGAIILYHMNRPESDTAAALIETLPKLQEQGFRFVHLREYHKHLK